MNNLFNKVTDVEAQEVVLNNAKEILNNRKFKMLSNKTEKIVSFLGGGIVIEYKELLKEFTYFTCFEGKTFLLTINLPILKVGEFGKFAVMFTNDPHLLLSLTNKIEISKFGE